MMIKNGIPLEMRGRCSAGQKMIASILFRLALSDCFSSNCNILALDEPTTNLDRENIESLAATLSQLIKERANAQLIIITHDEQFVELINRDGIDYFYKLRRGRYKHSDGYSNSDMQASHARSTTKYSADRSVKYEGESENTEFVSGCEGRVEQGSKRSKQGRGGEYCSYIERHSIYK